MIATTVIIVHPVLMKACTSEHYVYGIKYHLCREFFPKADSALSSGNAELVLEVVGDLVQATAAGDRAQLPRDVDTTSGIVTGTLDLLTHNLDQADNDTNTTTPDVC